MPSFKGFLITFCIGIAVTLGWQSYGDAAREMIANSYPQLGWVAPQPASSTQNAPNMIALAASGATPPDQQQLNAMWLDSVRQSIDRIAADIATNQQQIQQQITHSVDRLTASQEQMTREITKLRDTLYKNSEPPSQSATPPAGKPVPRSSHAPTALTPARNP